MYYRLGDYILVEGRPVSSGNGDKKAALVEEIVSQSYSVLSDPNMEILWFLEVLQSNQSFI